MDPAKDDILRRSGIYTTRYGIRLDRRLGFGKDGTVWQTEHETALKVLADRSKYEREAAAYARLGQRGVTNVRGHTVPQVERFDSELLAIEMTLVKPPFVLDFASAYLDSAAPQFPPDVMAEWVAEKREEFGSDWPRALAVLAGLRQLGIHMTDVHPGNIRFAEPVAAGESASS